MTPVIQPQQSRRSHIATGGFVGCRIRVADRLGIDVPGQLSVAGCDDVALAQQIYPALTTIRQPLAAMSEHAASALIKHSRDNSPLRGNDIFPGTMQIRESTGPVPS